MFDWQIAEEFVLWSGFRFSIRFFLQPRGFNLLINVADVLLHFDSLVGLVANTIALMSRLKTSLFLQKHFLVGFRKSFSREWLDTYIYNSQKFFNHHIIESSFFSVTYSQIYKSRPSTYKQITNSSHPLSSQPLPLNPLCFPIQPHFFHQILAIF